MYKVAGEDVGSKRSLRLVIIVQSETDCWGGGEERREKGRRGHQHRRKERGREERREEKRGEEREEYEIVGKRQMRGEGKAELGMNAKLQIDRVDPSNLPIMPPLAKTTTIQGTPRKTDFSAHGVPTSALCIIPHDCSA